MQVEGPRLGDDEEQPILPRQKIATYEELENPRDRYITPKKVGEILEEGVAGGFKRFTPDTISATVVGTMTGDSDYGVRMVVVKSMIAQCLFSPDEFAQFVRETSLREAQAAVELENRPTITPSPNPPSDSKVAKVVRTIFNRGQSQNSDEDLQKQRLMDTDQILRHRNNSRVYQTLGEIVDEMAEAYKNLELSIDDIFRLTELNHYFSGKWNGTGRNLTFTDPKIREFGSRLQQVVERLWRGGKFDEESSDPQNPLSEEDLFPARYPGQ